MDNHDFLAAEGLVFELPAAAGMDPAMLNAEAVRTDGACVDDLLSQLAAMNSKNP